MKAAEFKSATLAANFAARMVRSVPVLMGEGVYLVPHTPREAYRLIAAGYEVAPND